MADPKIAIAEKMTYQNSGKQMSEQVSIKNTIPRIELSLGLSESLMFKIRRAQNLESQRRKENVNIEETLEAVVNLYLEKKDPVRQARRQSAKGKIQPILVEKKNNASSLKKRTSLPANIRHQIQLRDRGRCTYTNKKGERCQSERFLEFHHIIPISQGGKDELNNLTTLCSGHHKCVHQ